MKLVKQDVVGIDATQGNLADELAEVIQQGKNFNNTDLVFVHQIIPEGGGHYCAVFNVYEEDSAVEKTVKQNAYTAK
jgi:hypothetical protein